jgi:hypothetical protein
MSLADKFNIPRTLHDYIVGVIKEETEYQAKVKALMAKKGIKSLADLSPDEKKAFFSQLDAMHQAKNEEKEPISESDGPVVWKKDKYSIEKKSDSVFCLYVDGKKVGEYPSLEDAKDAIEDEDEDDEEGEDMDEASSPAQQAAIAIAMKKAGKKPKDMEEQEHPEDQKTSANTLQKTGEKKWLAKTWEKGSKVNEAEGSGTSIQGTEAERAKATADRAKITLKSAQLRIKQAKEREALSKQKKAIKSEFDPLEESFSDAQIARLKQEYSKINTIDPSGEGYKKLTAMLDKLDKPTLEKLAGAGIKFVSGLARNRVNRLKEYSEFKQGGPELAKKFEKAHKAMGVDAKIKIKTVGNVSVNEEDITEAKSDYDLYHKDFSTAVQHAIKTAEKRGYQVDMDDWHNKVATGPRKPSEGKTNSYSITLMDKNGKTVKKALQMQVYNKGGQNPYELNMYIEDLDVNAMFSEAMKKDKKEATAKDKNKTVKAGDKLSGKQEPIEIQPEIKEDKK